MLHFLFISMALGAGWMAYTDGLIPMQVAAIGLFFTAYACCMGVLYRS
ncbi:MAG: hypothetical protein ACR2PM_12100 [Hyphomicrobiales bacterium]